MDIFIGALFVLNGVLFLIWSKKPDTPKWMPRVAIGLIVLGVLFVVGKMVFKDEF